MRDVYVIGIGQTPVGEHWEQSLRELGVQAISMALADAHVAKPQMLFVGNMLSGQLSRQENLGALLADYAGLRGIEAVKVEAACGSGGAALRMAFIAVASGICDVAVACGVEKMTAGLTADTTAALASAGDALYELEHGFSFVAINALLMQRYLHEYGYQRTDFANFALVAHRNAQTNPYAMFRRAISYQDYCQAKMIASPVSLLDSSGISDGAAAVVLASGRLGRKEPCIRIAGSALATDSVGLSARRNPLWLQAVRDSAFRAYAQAGIGPEDVDLFELHDAFSIMAALSLEASGFAPPGEGVRLAMENEISLNGRIPISTFGGLKARGHPVGATGIYQVVEAVLQLRNQAGPNQVADCRLAMTQNIGGSGASVTTHILERID